MAKYWNPAFEYFFKILSMKTDKGKTEFSMYNRKADHFLSCYLTGNFDLISTTLFLSKNSFLSLVLKLINYDFLFNSSETNQPLSYIPAFDNLGGYTIGRL